MASRGHIPYEGRPIQAPGMMRHGPFPGGHGPSGAHRPQEPLPPLELLENKTAAQAAEIERLVRENKRLAETHVAMRQEIVATVQEMERIQAHAGSFQTESDIQVRGLLEKIRQMEDDIRAGEMLKKDLQQARMEAQRLIAIRQELTCEIQLVREELEKASANIKELPELQAELDGLRQEHQKLRAAFEFEKGSNMEQVEQMRAMEKNLISLAREVEKLRAEVMNAEKGENTPNPPYIGTYGGPDPVYSSAGQGGGYGHGIGGGYSNAGFDHGGPAGYLHAYGRLHPPTIGAAQAVSGAGYSDAYGRPQRQMSSGPPAVSGVGYSDGYGRPQVSVAGGGVPKGEGVNHYGGGSDAARGSSIPS